MKTKLMMIWTLAALGALAAHADDPKPIKDSADQIQAQIGATSDSIKQSLDQIQNQSAPMQKLYQLADYRRKAPATQERIRKAFDAFNVFLQTEILSKIKERMDKYNAIVETDVYSDSQKPALLANLKNDKFMRELSAKYQDALVQLYAADGIDMIRMYRDNSSVRPESLLEPRLYMSRVFPVIAQGCVTTTCLALSYTEQDTLANHVAYGIFEKDKKNPRDSHKIAEPFDRTLQFQLKDGAVLNLLGTGAQPTNVLGTALEVVRNTNLYPPYAANLPEDVSDSQVDEQLVKVRAELTQAFRVARSDLSTYVIKSYEWNDANHWERWYENLCLVGGHYADPGTPGIGCAGSHELDAITDRAWDVWKRGRRAYETKELLGAEMKKYALEAEKATGIAPEPKR
jgi:hypothetical protein